MQAPKSWGEVFSYDHPIHVNYVGFRDWWLVMLSEGTGKEYSVQAAWEKYRNHLLDENISKKLGGTPNGSTR